MRRILITGSNRGIGLALVNQYLLQTDNVIFATCRNPEAADELKAIASENSNRVHLIPLNVVDPDSIQRAVSSVRAHADGLDVLINNAGILPGGVDYTHQNISTFGMLEADAILRVFAVNSISPVMITQAFAPLLQHGTTSRVINISSDAGSLHLRSTGCDYSYPASKAALNMLSRCLAGDLKEHNTIVISVHPGFINTEMGGVQAPLTLSDAIPTLVQTIDGLSIDDTGLFFNWDGKRLDW